MTRPEAIDLFETASGHRMRSPLTDDQPDLSVADAYAIQDELIALHEADGARVVGAKLGLTSRAKQVEMGIADPIRGWLTDRMVLPPGKPFEVASLGQPRAEPEIALIMGRDLDAADATAADVLPAIASVHAAVEILDSRYAGYKFTLPDVLADNASGGRFVIGPPVAPADIPDLGLLGCVFEQNGAVRAVAAGAATMGHPAAATAWLVRELSALGRGLRAGDIVLTGGLTAVAPLSAGDVVSATFDRLGSVRIECL
jgi:2-oxo-3-hexenedioate decarboxylase